MSMRKRFITNEENGTVIAILDDYEDVCKEVLRRCTNNTAITVLGAIFNFEECDLKELNTNSVFKGVAKCDGSDKYDERIGKDIAGNKADMKYHNAMAKKYKMIFNVLKEAAEEIDRLYARHTVKAYNIKNDLERCYLK